MIFDIHIIFSSQSIWEVFLSYLNLMSPTSHLMNLALQDSYRIFNQDCELVSQLPILSIRRLRNAKSRINTAFFLLKIKYLLKVYGKIELTRN